MGEIKTPTLDISTKLVDRAYSEVASTPLRDLIFTEMAFAREHDEASLALFQKLTDTTLDFDNPDKQIEMTDKQIAMTLGSLLSHKVLRYAVGGPFGGAQPPASLIALSEQAKEYPGQLEADFGRNWAQYPEVLGLGNKRLKNSWAQFGAKVMFVAHGQLANPGEQPFRLRRPKTESISQTAIPSPRSGRHDKLQFSHSTQRRMGALLGSRQF